MFEILMERLKEHKSKNGLSWGEVAGEIGISYSLVTKLAVGEKDNPTARTMQAIEDYLKRVEEAEAA